MSLIERLTERQDHPLLFKIQASALISALSIVQKPVIAVGAVYSREKDVLGEQTALPVSAASLSANNIRIHDEKQCKIAHDLFYGILELLDLDNPPPSLQADYTLSFENVLGGYNSYLIDSTKDSRLLEAFDTSRGLLDFNFGCTLSQFFATRSS
ncbi:hypothetical protein HBH98_041090 [Parastagonospora nodorum]|nr:hypothetical protein HBH54_054280 [Parastagonospora nodorum]KAH4039084.1 hypothetical protein HBI09_043680 [Parastagonospora nodorum]KAH4270401.1 hypothetical protein HBI03_042320 [Parastagonospora nodorum]KAH4278109.1 hypothetical protein HBI04_089690 [Parastagonospora nodorum]KAH4351069.1 hypothetical protein HBH98_041090 [Parastagonospora nodorum]